YETDCMGIVHHSNYIRYYEVARTEMLREFGTTYRQMERDGVMLPVLDVHSSYGAPAYDDDLLTVRVTLAELPKVRMRFDFEIYRENGERINTGSVTLALWWRHARTGPAVVFEIVGAYF
ncbi:MAG: acyl-CoA thioesterase, partial [Alistipes sp.]